MAAKKKGTQKRGTKVKGKIKHAKYESSRAKGDRDSHFERAVSARFDVKAAGASPLNESERRANRTVEYSKKQFATAEKKIERLDKKVGKLEKRLSRRISKKSSAKKK